MSRATRAPAPERRTGQWLSLFNGDVGLRSEGAFSGTHTQVVLHVTSTLESESAGRSRTTVRTRPFFHSADNVETFLCCASGPESKFWRNNET